MEQLRREFPDMSQSFLGDIVRTVEGNEDAARAILGEMARTQQAAVVSEEDRRANLITEIKQKFSSLNDEKIVDVLARHNWDGDAALVPLFELNHAIEMQRIQREAAEQQRIHEQRRLQERERARAVAKNFIQEIFANIPPEEIQRVVDQFEGDTAAISEHFLNKQTATPVQGPTTTSPPAQSSSAAGTASSSSSAPAPNFNDSVHDAEAVAREQEAKRKVKVDAIKARIGNYVSEAEIRTELLQNNWDTQTTFLKLLDVYENRVCLKFQGIYAALNLDEIQETLEDCQWNIPIANRKLNEKQNALSKRLQQQQQQQQQQLRQQPPSPNPAPHTAAPLQTRQPPQPPQQPTKKNTNRSRSDAKKKRIAKMEEQINENILKESIRISENPREIIQLELEANLRNGKKLGEVSSANNHEASSSSSGAVPHPPPTQPNGAPPSPPAPSSPTPATTTATSLSSSKLPPMPKSTKKVLAASVKIESAPKTTTTNEEDLDDFEDGVLLPIEEAFDIMLSLSNSRFECGESIVVSWSATDSSSVTAHDWIAIFPTEGDTSQYIAWNWIGKPELSGSLTFTAPSYPGNFQVKYFSTKASILRGYSFPFQVGPSFDMEAEIIDDGTKIAVHFKQTFGEECPNGWIGLFNREGDKSHQTYDWCSNATPNEEGVSKLRSGTITFPVARAGYWHFRFYPYKQAIDVTRLTHLIPGNDSVTLEKTDSQLFVKCDLNTVDPKAERCIVGIYLTNQSNNRQWIRCKSVGVRGKSELTFKLPTSPGEYQARVICNDSYDSALCVSENITIAE